MKNEQPVETPECIHCKHFFECKGKPEEVKQCLGFEDKKKSDE